MRGRRSIAADEAVRTEPCLMPVRPEPDSSSTSLA
jgi:hypothetical protein